MRMKKTVDIKIICIKDFSGFSFEKAKLIYNLNYIKKGYIYHIYEWTNGYVDIDRYHTLDGVESVVIKGLNDSGIDGIIRDGFTFYIPCTIFDEHFIPLAEYRNKQIDEILN